MKKIVIYVRIGMLLSFVLLPIFVGAQQRALPSYLYEQTCRVSGNIVTVTTWENATDAREDFYRLRHNLETRLNVRSTGMRDILNPSFTMISPVTTRNIGDDVAANRARYYAVMRSTNNIIDIVIRRIDTEAVVYMATVVFVP